MRLLVHFGAVVTVALALCGSAAARGERRPVPYAHGSRPDVAYTIRGELWLRSLSRAGAWHVATPWPVSGLSWSRDGRAIAFEGSGGIGIMVFHGHAGRIVLFRRLSSCCGAQLIWSPDSRYLAFSADTQKFGFENLWLWDRTTGHVRQLAHKVAWVQPIGTWSNDSTRFAVAVGTQIMNAPRNPTAEIVNVRSGHVTYLGKGVPGAWSPDDRFLGFDHLLVCGATGCFEREGIIPASGGHATILARSIRAGWRTYEQWTPRRYGYAYDRWLLGPHGHMRRRIPGQFDRVASWSPDGHWVAVRSVTRSLRIVLTLVNADTGGARRIFVSSPTGDCDACMSQGYQLIWNSRSMAVAILTPYVFGGFSEVNPSLYLYTLKPDGTWGRLSRGVHMKHPYPWILGWMEHDREVIVYSGRTLLRYVPGRGRLVPIVDGLSYSNLAFDDYAPPVGLRRGA